MSDTLKYLHSIKAIPNMHLTVIMLKVDEKRVGRLLVAVKGILTDFIKRALSKFLKFDFLASTCSCPLRRTFSQGIRLKSYHYKMRAIFMEIIVNND